MAKKNKKKIPTQEQFFDRYTANQPWLETEEWYGNLLGKRDAFYDRATADGKWSKQERRLRNKWDRKYEAASDSFRNYLNTNPYGVPTSGGSDGGGDDDPWSQSDQSAYDLMMQTLQNWGLGSLGGVVRGLIEEGITDSASITLRLQDTDEWRVRFAGNEGLKAAGLGVLSPAEYLALERSYAQVMRNYGLPSGFYDDPSDFAGFIGKSVSASELQSRVQAYSDLANREDSAIVAQLNSMGLSQGDLLAYMIDPSRAMPIIQQTYQTALIGGAARRAGVVADNDYLKQLAGQGVTEQQASQGYGLIAGSLADATTLAGVYNEDYDMRDMESEIFQNDGQAANKRKRLASQERAAFSGSAGVGNLTRSSAGQF